MVQPPPPGTKQKLKASEENALCRLPIQLDGI
mgnify:FL=1